MNMKPGDFPAVTFNPHKHHLGFLKQRTNIWSLQPWAEVAQELCCIGTNLIDIYCGRLTVSQIYKEISDFAVKHGLTDADKLSGWLKHEEYMKMMLSDQSLWIIRHGQNPDRFLHIHPAKYSLFTVRVRASTLKTVIALKVSGLSEKENHLKLQAVNQVRVGMLNLSPIKGLETGKGITRIWNFFNEQGH